MVRLADRTITSRRAALTFRAMSSEEPESLDDYVAQVWTWARKGASSWRADIREDAAQEAAVEAVRRAGWGERDDEPYWVRAGHNKAVDLDRSERTARGEPGRRRPEVEVVPEPHTTLRGLWDPKPEREPSVLPEPFAAADDGDDRVEAVRAAVEQLAEGDRVLLRLLAEGIQHRDIAEQLGVTADTVRQRVAALRRRFQAAVAPAAPTGLTLEAIGLGFLGRRADLARRLPQVALENQGRYREHDRWADAYQQVRAGQLGPVGDVPDDAAIVAAHLGWRLLAGARPRCWAKEAAPARFQPLRGQADSVWAICLVLALQSAREPATLWLELQARVEHRCALGQLEGIRLDQAQSIIRADERHPLPAPLVAAAEAFAASICRIELFRS
ncbi:MAG: hypothetical protein JWN67_1132 [Actinomycetia bacterium]|nr:hypothetical protein [Actinomycetes bacterium]